MNELIGEMKPEYRYEPGEGVVSETELLLFEINCIERYLEALKLRYKELTDDTR